jgi:hypothetical protein
MDLRRLAEMRHRLGEAALDPTIWPAIMEQNSTTVGATGAVLLQSDIRTPDVPRTSSVEALVGDISPMAGRRATSVETRGYRCWRAARR